MVIFIKMETQREQLTKVIISVITVYEFDVLT